jgi:adenylate kinase family enzyme
MIHKAIAVVVVVMPKVSLLIQQRRKKITMKRILILGSGGAGTTLARSLGKRLNIEIIHLDSLYWHPHWVETPKHQWERVVKDLLARETWIMDGNYGSTLDMRLEVADTVIFLNLPRYLCLWRVFQRRLLYAGKTRPDIGKDCRERLSWEFLQYIWTYPTKRTSVISKKIDRLQPHQQAFVLRSTLEVKQFLDRVLN